MRLLWQQSPDARAVRARLPTKHIRRADAGKCLVLFVQVIKCVCARVWGRIGGGGCALFKYAMGKCGCLRVRV